MTTTPTNPTAPSGSPEWRLVGRPTARVDGAAKVTGAARFTADVKLPATAWARLLRSPYAHARVVSIHADAARSAPGVLAVLTAGDLPRGIRIGRRVRDIPLLADEVVRYVGEPVVAIVAERREDAEAALELIEVEYDELPAVLDIDAALAPDAPVVHPELRSYAGVPDGLPSDAPPNVMSVYRLEQGDVEQGFADADLIVEETFSTSMVHQAYGEPHAALAWFREEADGAWLEAWATHKQPFALRDLLSELLGLPEERVRVHPVLIGGDFGGKGSAFDAPLAALLSRVVGRPVRMVMTQAEELAAANPRLAARLTLKTGLARDGRLLARDASIVLDSGAYAGHRPLPHANLSGVAKAGGAYRVASTRIVSTAVYTNHVPCGHMRAPGSVQTLFAVESHMDSCAAAVGLDPAEFRRRNVIRAGDVSPVGEHWEHVIAPEVLERTVSRAASWNAGRAPDEGVGIAFGMYGTGPGTSGSTVQATADGTILLLTATPEPGTGSHTVLTQVVAEELGVPGERVRVVPRATDAAAFDAGSGGSRVTHVAGNAARQAAIELRRVLAEAAAEHLGCPPAELAQDPRDGAFVDPRQAGTDGDRFPFVQAVAEARALAGLEDHQPLEASSEFTPARRPEQESFVGCVARVGVDAKTGAVQLRRVAAVVDVGTVIYPQGLIGQIEGGIAQGVGFALSEQCPIDESGRVVTANLNDYKIPAATDLPNIEVEVVNGSQGAGPYGAKGAGELAIGVVAPAIANAVAQASGARIRDLPITAEKLFWALRET